MAKTVIQLDDRKLQEIIRGTDQRVKRRVIADGVTHGVFVELGTSRMAARPALVPAFEQHTRGLGDALGKAVEAGDSLDDVLAKVAFDIQGDWAGNVPVATGALKNSIHVEEE